MEVEADDDGSIDVLDVLVLVELVEVLVLVELVDVLVELVDVLVLVLVDELDEELLLDVDVVLTTTGAVSPVGTIVKPSAVAPALFRYVPSVPDAVTAKCSESVPETWPLAAGTVSGPLQVNVWFETAGSLVVAPVVEPLT